MNLRFFITCFSCSFFVDVVISTTAFCLVNNASTTRVIDSISIKETCPEDTVSIFPSVYGNDFLKGVKKLYQITINNPHLKLLERGFFNNMTGLYSVWMKNNNFPTIKSGTIRNLPKLYYLTLDNNQISSLEPGAFTNLPEMYQLGLCENKLTEIKNGVFVNVTVEYLDLGKNRIRKIEPGAFSGLVKHKHLELTVDLGINKLEEINSAVFSHPNLTRLNLSSNEISQLRSGDLANLPELINLDLSHNKLKKIPEGVFNSTKLEILNLASNQLSTISSGAFDNLSLRKIRLDSNSLSSLESDWFLGCSQVTKLSVANNAIQEIPDDAFKNLPKLLILDLSSNHIEAISSQPFKVLNLSKLLLKRNKLEEWGEDLKGIKVKVLLDIRGNKIPCPEGGSKSFSSAKFVLSNCDFIYKGIISKLWLELFYKALQYFYSFN